MAQKKEEQAQKPEKKTCFVIMPFSDPEGYERGHFRRIYEYTFVPAIRAAGYEPLRIDDNSVSNLIHGKMMNELISAPMVLCDLSTNNPNVLYELGIRHAFDKPVVLVQEVGQDRIFDIGAITSVEYHPTRLYEEVIKDQEKITEAILQTANAKNTYSIMSLAMLQSAQPASGNSITSTEQVEYLMQEMAQMSRKMGNLEKKFENPELSVKNNQITLNLYSEKERLLVALNDLVREIEYDLSFDSSLSEIRIETLREMLLLKFGLCLRNGADATELRPARMLIGRLDSMLAQLRSRV